MAKSSLDLIEMMRQIAEACSPITGRGVGYKLFVAGLIPSMSNQDMAKVYRLLGIARERGLIPWRDIVDESRVIERVSTWSDPEAYAECVARSYRRDFWDLQPCRVLVVSEKGTVRGVLEPVLNCYAVGFLPVGGFSSKTKIYDLATDDDGRPLVILYVGDWDPSGLCMSLIDLPTRIQRYGGSHIELRRIALTRDQLRGLPSFSAKDKRDDPRYPWFVKEFGQRCWELDAMDPNDLRDCVKAEIVKLIEPGAWQRCEIINEAEKESLQTILAGWGRP